MSVKEIENDVTGLSTATNRKEAEYNLLESLLSAAGFQDSEESILEVEMKRRGKYLFTVRIHPLSDKDVAFARKKATVYMPNPNNKKLPPIEKDFNHAKFNGWIVYLATVEEDQEQIWGNKELMQKLGVMESWEVVGKVLTAGEKNWLADKVYEISGMDESDDEFTDEEEYAKN